MSRVSLLLPIMLAACGGSRPQATVPAPPPTGVEAPPVVAEAPPVAAPTPTAKATKVRSVEGITEYRLDNGLSVLLFPDPTQSTITVNVTYLVGSRLEGYGETGMAHLLEHMMFKGSPRHRNVLKLVGARGGELNGSTWNDRTNYYETLPASQENLDWALDLESDRMLNASISPDDLKTEFSVVRNEFEMGENNPEGVLEQRIVSTAYLWHNYGKDTIGSRADIERVPVPALRRFYEKYYQPDNAVLIVSGKFDDAAALASIGKTFGVLPRPTRKLEDSYTIEPVQDGERTVVLRRNGDVSIVGVAYHTVGAASPDYPAVRAAIDVLTRQPSGRLYKKLVETKLATELGGYQQIFRDPFVAYLDVKVRDPKNVDKVEATMFAELESLGSSKIDDKEVERWRANELKQIELEMANSQGVAVALSEFVGLGDWRTLFAYRNGVTKITAADVQRVAKTYFKASNRTSGRFLPTKDADRAPLTESPDVQAVVKGIEGGEVKEAGEAFAATLENVDARTARKELKGGIKAAFLPKKTRGGKVALELALHWGDEKTLQHKDIAAELATQLLNRGTTKHSYQDIQDLKDQLKARIYISGDASGLTLHIETLRDKLPAALDLGIEMLTSPAFPDKQLELIRTEQLAQLEAALHEPEVVASQTLQQLLSKWPKGDPRYAMSTQEQIDGIKAAKLGDAKAFYRDFIGAGHGELVAIGDFDPQLVADKVEKGLAGWTSKAPYKRLDNKVFGVPGQQKSVDIKDKENSLLIGMYDLSMKDVDPDYPAWLLVGQILGGGGGSRVWMRVREKEGLSYGVAAWTAAGSLDDAGSLGIYAIVAPQNLAKAKASLLDEIGKMSSGKVEADELARAKDEWTKSIDTGLSNDEYVIQLLQHELYRGRSAAFMQDLRKKVAAVTAADIERVAKQHVHADRLVIVDAGDQSKSKSK